jgi:heme A synthase
MTFDEWILALHVLSAFALVAAIVLFWVLIVAVRRTDLPGVTAGMEPMAKVGNVAVVIGIAGTIVFGIWLALSYGDYDLWDGWIIGAIVLWAIATETGRRSGTEYTRAMEKAQKLQAAGQTGPSPELGAMNRTQSGLLMHTLSSLATLFILIDMIWKPGA